MDDQYIIGLDLSKSSTGFSLFSISDKGSIKHLSSGDFAFTGHSKTSYTKQYSRAKVIIMDKLSKWLQDQIDTYGLTPDNTTVSLEAPIFSSFASEIQFYFNQCVLEYFDDRHMDVVGYPPMTIKLFAKCCAEGVKFGKKALTKDQMREIYDNHLHKLNPKSLPPSEDMSDDEIDAIFIAFIGIVCHSKYLPFPSEKKHVGIGLYREKDSFLESMKEEAPTLKFKGIIFSKTNSIYDQFKPVFDKMIGTNHLTLRSKHYYPYAQTHYLSNSLKLISGKDLEASKEFMKEALGVKDRKLSNILKTKNNQPSNFKFIFDKKGNLQVE